MRKYTDKDILKARGLREREGYSFAHLQRVTGIPATTIRNWCDNLKQKNRWDTLLKTNERIRGEIRKSELSVIDSLGYINNEQAKLFASILYWCEGAKYPASNAVAFVNSDPTLITLFISLLRKGFPIDESKFRIHLQIHDVQNFEELREFWSKKTNISISQFMKPTVTKRRNGKHRVEYFGTCTIKYYNFRLLLKLTGIYEGFCKKFGGIA